MGGTLEPVDQPLIINNKREGPPPIDQWGTPLITATLSGNSLSIYQTILPLSPLIEADFAGFQKLLSVIKADLLKCRNLAVQLLPVQFSDLPSDLLSIKENAAGINPHG